MAGEHNRLLADTYSRANFDSAIQALVVAAVVSASQPTPRKILYTPKGKRSVTPLGKRGLRTPPLVSPLPSSPSKSTLISLNIEPRKIILMLRKLVSSPSVFNIAFAGHPILDDD